MGDSGVKVRVALDPVEAAEWAELLKDRKVQDPNLRLSDLMLTYLLAEADEALALEKALRLEGYLVPGRTGSAGGGAADIRVLPADVAEENIPDGSWEGPEGDGVYVLTIGTLLLPGLRQGARFETAKRRKVGQPITWKDLQGYAAFQIRSRGGKDHTALLKRRAQEENQELQHPAKKKGEDEEKKP